MIFPLKIVGLVLGLTLVTAHAADSDYWQHFEKENSQNGTTLMQHIQNLSVITENEVKNQYNKEALAYFLATGGKKGFRKQPATQGERETLVKALVTLTHLHRSSEQKKGKGRFHFLNLVETRQQYGLESKDSKIQSHLDQAHAIITHTLLAKAYIDLSSVQRDDKPKIQATVRGSYLGPVFKTHTLSNTDENQTHWFTQFINDMKEKEIDLIVKTSLKSQHTIDQVQLQQIQNFLRGILTPPETKEGKFFVGLFKYAVEGALNKTQEF